MTTRRLLAAGTLAALAVPRVLRAQAVWPGDRAIEIIVPVPPGGGLDAMARLTAQHLAPRLGSGVRMVTANRPGAGGQLGNELIFNAAPDGYTLGAITAPALPAMPIERPVRYRTAEFTWLANVVEDPNTFWVAANSPLRSLADLRAAARAQPGVLNYGTSGIGGDDHIAMLGFEALTETPPMVHVPFTGSAPATQSLLGGHLTLLVGNISEAIPLLREGRLRSLGVMAASRYPAAPEVPTFREQGVALDANASRGFVAPPNLPPAIREKLETAFAAVLASPEFRADAERAAMPLRPVLGADYARSMAAMDANLRALWQRRPWKE